MEHQSHGWRQGDAVALLGLVALCSLCILSLLSLLLEAIMDWWRQGYDAASGGGRALDWWRQGDGLVGAGRWAGGGRAMMTS